MMQKIIFLSVWISLFGPLRTQAQLPQDPPPEICDPTYYQCSGYQRQIVSDYNQGTLPAFTENDALFVGSCYMLGESYDSEHEHHGYIYLRRGTGPQKQLFDFYGEFAFFYDENPYEEWSPEKARAIHSQPSRDHIFENQEHWQSDISQDPPMQYFIKQNNNHHLSMIGLWGRNDAVFCQLHLKSN